MKKRILEEFTSKICARIIDILLCIVSLYLLYSLHLKCLASTTGKTASTVSITNPIWYMKMSPLRFQNANQAVRVSFNLFYFQLVLSHSAYDSLSGGIAGNPFHTVSSKLDGNLFAYRQKQFICRNDSSHFPITSCKLSGDNNSMFHMCKSTICH